MHDYDDEGTMEEEENLSSDSGDTDEIDDLQKVNLPIELLCSCDSLLMNTELKLCLSELIP